MRVYRAIKRSLAMGRGLLVLMTLTVVFAVAEKAHADELMDQIKSLMTLIDKQSYQYPVKPDYQNSTYHHIIKKAADRYRLDPKLIQAIIHIESGSDPGAVSKKGAVGLMQLMPSTAREIGVTKPFDPYQNVMGGSYYYRKMLSLHNGNHRKALWSYNCGPGCVERDEVPRESKDYADRTLRMYRNLKRKETVKK